MVAGAAERSPGLVIGVTGHRDIDSRDPRLTEIVGREMEQLRLRAADPHTSVLSCLAEGADRMVARLGLDLLGSELVATLPMPPSEYRRDFYSARSREEFDELLAAARKVVVLVDGRTPPEGYQGGARTHRYACAGAYIVAHCDVLIALWDGQPARGLGGTGQIVDWMLSGEVPPEFSLDASGNRLDPVAGPGRVVHVDPATGAVRYLGD